MDWTVPVAAIRQDLLETSPARLPCRCAFDTTSTALLSTVATFRYAVVRLSIEAFIPADPHTVATVGDLAADSDDVDPRRAQPPAPTCPAGRIAERSPGPSL